MTREARVVIIGAGPAGLSAAEEAAVHGLAVDVVEESARLGGQYFRSRQTSLRPGSPRHFSAARTGARVRVGTVMVDAEPGAVVVWSSDLGTEALPYDALVVATGAYDRPVSIPGWTLPGVVTAGGAHTLAKAYGLAPGRRMVVAGAGPFLLSVSTALATHGYDVETFDATPWSAVVRGTLVLAQHPTYLLQGAWLTGKLLRHGESVHHGQMITAIHGTERVEAVSVAAVDADWAPRPGTERVIDADGVCLGFGFVPSLEIAQLLGCDIRYSRRTSDYSVVTDPWMRCSEERIYAAGEVTGIAGVESAVVEGRLAALAAARDLHAITPVAFSRRAHPLMTKLSRLRGWARWMAATYRVRPALWSLASEATVICRCEDVTLSAVQDALGFNLAEPVSVKAATRAGMGLCQGRICSFVLTEMLRARHGYLPPEDGRPWSIRPPIKPVPLSSWPAPKGEDQLSEAGRS